MSSIHLEETFIKGVFVAQTSVTADHRGAFSRLFCSQALAPAIGSRQIVQINHSRTVTVGALRGMHLQRPPSAETKMVRCLAGKVWDVALDLRSGSPTFRQWYAEELTPGNARALIIPEGCAHGFQVLAENSELLYLHTAFYDPGAERGFAHDDEAFGISWPLPVTEVSARDQGHSKVTAAFSGIQLS